MTVANSVMHRVWTWDKPRDIHGPVHGKCKFTSLHNVEGSRTIDYPQTMLQSNVWYNFKSKSAFSLTFNLIDLKIIFVPFRRMRFFVCPQVKVGYPCYAIAPAKRNGRTIWGSTTNGIIAHATFSPHAWSVLQFFSILRAFSNPQLNGRLLTSNILLWAISVQIFDITSWYCLMYL